jgi:hypothetical protein
LGSAAGLSVYSRSRSVCGKHLSRYILKYRIDNYSFDGLRDHPRVLLISGEVLISCFTCLWLWLHHHIFMDCWRHSTTIMEF